MKKRRWQDVVTLIMGLWLFVSPFVLHYYLDETYAAPNAFVYGLALTAISGIALIKPEAWEEWVNLLIGLWLIAAPFVLGFEISIVATWNHLILGVLVTADAIWALMQTPSQKVATR